MGRERNPNLGFSGHFNRPFDVALTCIDGRGGRGRSALSNEDTLIERFPPRPKLGSYFKRPNYVASGFMVRDIAPGGCTLYRNLSFGVSGIRCGSLSYCGNWN